MIKYESAALILESTNSPMCWQKRTMSSTWFNFSDQIDPIDYVVSISDTMHVCVAFLSVLHVLLYHFV